MKSDSTFVIEHEMLEDLMNLKEFTKAEDLVTRMLTQYNRLDYELLLKRARIKQCQMKYEEAIEDANLAHNIAPERIEAYQALSDFLIAINEHEKALKVLSIINNDENSKPMFEMINRVLADKRDKEPTK